MIPVISGDGVQLAPISSGFSYLVHFVAYFVLAMSWFFYFDKHDIHTVLLKSALIAGTYGCFIEVIQLFTPTRLFDFLDIVLNYMGAFAIFLFYKIMPKKVKDWFLG